MVDKAQILNTLGFKQLLDELQEAWNDEQRQRHEFWAEVDENRKTEFILGEIVYHSPIYGRHWMCSTNLLTELLPYVRKHKLGMVAIEKTMIRLTRNDYEPDVCFWRTERTTDFGAKQSAFPAPDFVVEILSDSTRDRDYGVKKSDYALHGITEYWIIDPDLQTVEQYLLKNTEYELIQKIKEGSLGSEMIEGFRIDVEDLFSGF